ncbi:MAG: alpha-L-fucosidase, partial [Bacteroidota bacterium]|nr:alpha-L-fucosidase [Bacteroidota bacterium]
AGSTCWSTIDTEGLAPGKADPHYLNTGDPRGKQWVPAETDVSIRPGWFYHASENDKVKSPGDLVNLYYQSVGRNSLLLLNIPPDPEGLLSKSDIRSIVEFRKILNQTFKLNLAAGAAPAVLTDNRLTSFEPLAPGGNLVVPFHKPVTFDRILLMENITRGERVSKGRLDYWDGKAWKKLAEFTTIGYKRLLRIPPVTTAKIRLTIESSYGKAEIAALGLYKASPLEDPVTSAP